MRKVIIVFKALALLAVASAAVAGFAFFRAWRANETPVASSITWMEESVTLGRATVLRLDVTGPWHREIVSAKPSGLPDSLVTVSVDPPLLVRGPLDWSGRRHWHMEIPLVATEPGAITGETVEFSLSSTRRKSPRKFPAALPDLAVETPDDVPASPLNPLELLSGNPPPPPPSAVDIGEESRPHYLPILAAMFVIGAGVYFLIRRLRRPAPDVPAWMLAHSQLDRLQRESSLEPERFFSRLTDILKRYTASRFHDNATSASSTELIASIQSIPELDAPHPSRLSALVRQADAVKFAGTRPSGDAPGLALETVRSFVDDTTPAPDPENA